jgi:hypothetical protein
MNTREHAQIDSYLIVTPREHDIIEATIRFIDSILSRINSIVVVWVASERFGVYVLLRESAANDKGILDYRSPSVYVSS